MDGGSAGFAGAKTCHAVGSSKKLRILKLWVFAITSGRHDIDTETTEVTEHV